MGQPPSWWGLLQAARYLRVPPWDLAVRPVWWTRVALTAMDAEARENERASRKRG